MQKEAIRTDIVTRLPYKKEELLRFVMKNGRLAYDPSKRSAGRGVYVHPSSLEKAKDGKAFSRAFRRHISPEEIEEAIHACR